MPQRGSRPTRVASAATAAAAAAAATAAAIANSCASLYGERSDLSFRRRPARPRCPDEGKASDSTRAPAASFTIDRTSSGAQHPCPALSRRLPVATPPAADAPAGCSARLWLSVALETPSRNAANHAEATPRRSRRVFRFSPRVCSFPRRLVDGAFTRGSGGRE